jgi:hypothetical protein
MENVDQNFPEILAKRGPIWTTASISTTTISKKIMFFCVQDDQGADVEQDDEITNLLLKHEKSNKQPAAVIPGDESDSDNRSAARLL